MSNRERLWKYLCIKKPCVKQRKRMWEWTYYLKGSERAMVSGITLIVVLPFCKSQSGRIVTVGTSGLWTRHRRNGHAGGSSWSATKVKEISYHHPAFLTGDWPCPLIDSTALGVLGDGAEMIAKQLKNWLLHKEKGHAQIAHLCVMMGRQSVYFSEVWRGGIQRCGAQSHVLPDWIVQSGHLPGCQYRSITSKNLPV